MEPYDDELFWLVICGFVVAFILAFGIGANDVANSFGTSVGSKVLTLTQACILATIFEIAGAVLIGYKVSDTMRKGILDVSLYNDGGERLLAAGCLAALIAGAAWLILATALRLPVSGTHSIVGATVGFTLTAKGPTGIRWSTLGAIVLSWFISPALSGAVSATLFWLVRRYILRAPEPLVSGLRALPFFYGATVAVNVISVVHDGPKLLSMDNIPMWIALVGSVALGVVVAACVRIFLVPYYRRCLCTPPVNFTLGLSNETTPANTPTHFNKTSIPQRPTSLLSEDGKLLEVIAESAEMVTLSDVDKCSVGVKEMNARNRALLATMDDCSILSRSLSPSNKSRLQLVDADPQINTLKYIDETLSCCKSLDSSQLAGMGESYGSDSRNGFLGDSCDTIARGEFNSLAASRGLPPVTDIDTSPPPRLDKGPEGGSAWSIECDGRTARLPALTPNSSAAPLLRAASPKRTPPPPPPPDTLRLFSFLQVLTATFGAFAHGGNDVSNAIGPLVALWLLYSEGGAHARAETPLAILVFGGVGIALGLWLWGRRVIQTVGEDLTSITADTGFTIELGAALTVLVASKVGLPVSTTHCKVGSVVCVGYFSEKAVDWSLFRNIIFAWVVTVPAVAGMAALSMLALEAFVV
ncbi:unnamed protein product [Parnassius mnemosyne]|uniref:Phosphate transporter n=1 Tax=Parnassius mnemosyne TaxID=213953 RepID=A0AAV1LY18_9NEOP